MAACAGPIIAPITRWRCAGIEAAGLAMKDIYLDEELPHVSIRTQSWRSLKTRSSERVVPLVGASL